MMESTNSPMVKDDIMFWVIIFRRVSTVLHNVNMSRGFKVKSSVLNSHQLYFGISSVHMVSLIFH